MGDARQNKYMIQNNLGVTQAGLPCVPTDLSTLHFVNFRQRSSSRRLVLPPFTLIQIQCNLASCRTRPLSMCAAAVFIPGSCRTRVPLLRYCSKRTRHELLSERARGQHHVSSARLSLRCSLVQHHFASSESHVGSGLVSLLFSPSPFAPKKLLKKLLGHELVNGS